MNKKNQLKKSKYANIKKRKMNIREILMNNLDTLAHNLAMVAFYSLIEVPRVFPPLYSPSFTFLTTMTEPPSGGFSCAGEETDDGY